VFVYLVFRIGSFLASHLPTWLTYRVALLAGSLMFYLQSGRRANVMANLRQVLGPETPSADVARLTRGVFRNGAINYLELLRLPTVSLDEVRRRVTLHGFEHIDAALAAGKGVILISGHLGGFDYVAQVLGTRGLSAVVPAEPIQPRRLFEFVTRLRNSHGLRFVRADVGVMFGLVKALRRNEIVGLAIDRDVRGDGLPLPFFGATTTFQPGAAILARKLGTPVIPVFIIRRPDFSADVFVEPPLGIIASDDAERDTRENLETMLAVVAKYIQSYPDQWVAFEPVWPGQRSQYAAA
jgi:phosphatidylinositol dimannoside acyltransferase